MPRRTPGSRARTCRAPEYYRERPRVALEKARDAAERALQLDPALSEAHLALGDVRRMLQWDTRAARSAYSQAIALNPSYESAHRAYAVMLTSLGRHAQAIRESRPRLRARSVLPRGATPARRGFSYAAGDYGAAIDQCRHTMDMDDRYYPAARRLLGAAHLQLGQDREALQVLEAACEAATSTRSRWPG